MKSLTASTLTVPPMAADPDLGTFIDRHATATLDRVETLNRYDVSSDGGDFAAYVAGEPGPDPKRKAAWHKVLQTDLDRRIVTRRVHIVTSPLSDYLRYEFEWGYAQNLAYEDIRILDLAEVEIPRLECRSRVALADRDFWLIDGEHVAVMDYDDAGRYTGYEIAPAADLGHWLSVWDVVWQYGVPFEDYWAAHRQYWRRNHRAA